ncbi:MAG: histidine phosphatase family protein [Chloroflexi bacterium]|nr:histidine phosphatase family protein [Chloroflexota bacterium]
MDSTNAQAAAEGTAGGYSIRRLWLVRHGVTQWNVEQRFCGHSDIQLSVQGRAQARWLARRLEREAITAIYTSDLLRARETAEIIAKQCGQAVQICASAAWREIAFGAWEGLTYAQIVQEYGAQQDFFTDPLHGAPPGGEALMDLAQRVWTAFVEIALSAGNASGDAVLVSHGGTLRVLLCRILGIPLERQWQLQIDPGSLSAIDLVPVRDESTPLATLALLNVQRQAS